MKQEEIRVYVAEDGKVFLTESACIEHEKLSKKLRFYKVYHDPDLTETGILTTCTAFAVEPYRFDVAINIIEKFCFDEFGFGSGIQGYGLMKYFSITQITKEEFDTIERKKFIGTFQREGFPKVFNYLEKWNLK